MTKREKFNGGTWTESRYRSFVKSALRSASKRWPPKFECLHSAYTGQRINPATGRLAKHYRCAGCGGEFVGAKMQADHIEPVVPLTGFTTWDEIIERMFCEADNFQALCLDCHKEKSAQERRLAKEYKKNG